MKGVVFLGGGRITSALLAGVRLHGDRSRIVVHDRNGHKLRALKREFGIVPEPDLVAAVQQAKLLMIAVRPDGVREVLKNLKEAFPKLSDPKRRSSGLVVCSLAAGTPLANLQRQLPVPWARAMPSPASRAGRGLTALTFPRGLQPDMRRQVRSFFGRVGPVLELPERRFDAFTVTYSASHGYHALAALARAAQKLGLDRKSAFLAAAHALADGILAWREGSEPLEALLNEAATPNGIAATVMAEMDRAGYTASVERGLRAGVARTRKNATL